MATKSFNQNLAVNGTSNGVLTVNDSTGFEVGATVLLAAKNERIQQLKVASKPSPTSVMVVTVADAVFDASAFTVAKQARLFQPREALLVPSAPPAQPFYSGSVDRTTTIAAPDGATELVLNADSGHAFIVKKNNVNKLLIDADGNIVPALDETINLGSPGYNPPDNRGRFKSLYICDIRDSANLQRWWYHTNSSWSGNIYKDASNPPVATSIAHAFTTNVQYNAGKLVSFSNAGVEKLHINYAGDVVPAGDGTSNLGGPSNRFVAHLTEIRGSGNYTRWSYITNAAYSPNIYTDGVPAGWHTSSSVAHIFSTYANYGQGKLVSFQNFGTEKAYIDKDGKFSAAEIIVGGGTPISKFQSATTTWNPGTLADGAVASTTVTITGAALGDVANAAYAGIGAKDVLISANVQAADTVRVVIMNKSGESIVFSDAALRVGIVKFS